VGLQPIKECIVHIMMIRRQQIGIFKGELLLFRKVGKGFV
jgi:hypothetical protein